MKYTEQLQTNRLRVPNRLVMPPMATHKSGNGRMETDQITYYTERAMYSGVGLIITEHSYIHPYGRDNSRQVSIASEENIEDFKVLTKSVHEKSKAKIICQINYAGSRAKEPGDGGDIVGPSAVGNPSVKGPVPRSLTVSEIHKITGWFADATRRAKKAGFDGVEIHAAHGYLLNQFYSPLTNLRTDDYGSADVQHRIRFLVEVVRSVRESAGPDYPIAVRFGGCDYMEGGSTIEDCVEACKILEKESVDLLDISGGMCVYTRKGYTQAGYFSDMAEAVKQAVSVPVLTTGGVKTLREAEELLAGGCADLIGVGRAIMRDAHWIENQKKVHSL